MNILFWSNPDGILDKCFQLKMNNLFKFNLNLHLVLDDININCIKFKQQKE